MKSTAGLSRFGLLACLVLLAGCSGGGVGLLETEQVQEHLNSGPEPMVIVTVAPTRQWMADLQRLVSDRGEYGDVDLLQFANALPGIDKQQPMTLLLYASKRGTFQPIVYLPVTDYEKFLDGLATRVRLHRAFASSFTMGSQKILVKPVGEYAVFGTSLKLINKAPSSPELHCNQLPIDADFALSINTTTLRESDKQKFANFVGDYLGSPCQRAAVEVDSLVFGLKIDPQAGLQLQTEFQPVPQNLQQINESLEDLFVAAGMKVASKMTRNGICLNFDLDSTQLNSAWSKMESLVTDSFQAQRQILMQQVSTQNRAPLPKIFYGNIGSNSSSCEPAGSGGRRSGGG